MFHLVVVLPHFVMDVLIAKEALCLLEIEGLLCSVGFWVLEVTDLRLMDGEG